MTSKLEEERDRIEKELDLHNQKIEERDEEHRMRTEGLNELERDHRRRRSSICEEALDPKSLEHEKRALLKLKRDMFLERSRILSDDAKRQTELEDQLERYFFDARFRNDANTQNAYTHTHTHTQSQSGNEKNFKQGSQEFQRSQTRKKTCTRY